MTEPRNPEPMEHEGETSQPEASHWAPPDPEAPKVDPGNWYPVATSGEEPASDSAPDAQPAQVAAEDGETAILEPVAQPAVPEPEAEAPVAQSEAAPAGSDAEHALREPAMAEPEVADAAIGEPASAEPAVQEVAGAEPDPESSAEPAPEPLTQAPAAELADAPVSAPAPEPEPVAEATEPIEGEATTVQPQPAITEAIPTATAPTEAIFRPDSPSTSTSPEPEPTRMEQLSDEEQKLAAERSARREARTAALAATAPIPLPPPAPVIIHKRTNDKFWGSLGLFLLRIVVAGIFGVRGLNMLTDIPAAQAMFARTVIPEPQIMAIVTGVACLLIALSLVLGLLTRVAGLGIALIAGGALAFVYWGSWSPFVAGQAGFLGEFELLLAGVGLLYLLVGGGGWSLDRSFRSGREQDKAERSAAAE